MKIDKNMKKISNIFQIKCVFLSFSVHSGLAANEVGKINLQYEFII